MMTPESEAFLNALVPAEGAVTTDLTEEVYALLDPLHEVLDKVEGHLQEIDRLRRKADAAEANPQIYGWFERFKQTIDAARRLNADAKKAVEAISDVCFQLDNYAREMRETITTKYEKAGTRVVLSKDEHDHLKATVDEQNKQLAIALTELNDLRAAHRKGA